MSLSSLLLGFLGQCKLGSSGHGGGASSYVAGRLLTMVV